MEDGFGTRTYRDMLAVIGAQFDSRGCQDVVLAEVVDGFIARVTRGDDPVAEGIAYSFDELRALAPSLPQSEDSEGHITYRALFGALGGELDRLRARMITVLDLPLGLLVTFYPAGFQLEGPYGERYEFIFEMPGLRELLAVTHGQGSTGLPEPMPTLE